MEDHPTAQNAQIHAAVALVDQSQELCKGGLLFGFLKDTVVERHSLGGLTLPRHQHGGKVHQMGADGLAVEGRLATGIRRLGGLAHGLQKHRHLVRGIHGHNGVRHRKGGLGLLDLGVTPVTQTDVKQSLFIHAGAQVFEVGHEDLGVFGDHIRLPPPQVGVVGQMGQHTVPRGAVAPGKSPAPRRDNTGKTSLPVLGLAYVAQPLTVVAFGIKIDEGGLTGQSRVRRPAVLLAVRAVGGEMVEVGQDAPTGDLLDLIRHGIRAGKSAPILHLGVHDQVGQEIGGGLLGRDAVHADIAEAVVGEGGGIGLHPFTLADIGVQMDDILVPLPEVTDEPHVVQTDIPVLQSLGETQLDLLPRLPLDRETEKPRVVLSEIVNKALPTRENGHRRDLPLHRDGGNIRHPQFSRRRLGGYGKGPRAIVKIGELPPLDFRLAAGVIALTEAVVVPQDGGGRYLEGSVPREQNRPVRTDHLQGHLGRGTEGGLVKVPDIPAGVVHKAIAKDQTHGVGTLLQSDLVLVIVHQILGVGEVGGQESLRQPLTVEVQLIDTADRHPQGRGGLVRNGHLTAEAVGGDVIFKGIARGRRANVGLAERHDRNLL